MFAYKKGIICEANNISSAECNYYSVANSDWLWKRLSIAISILILYYISVGGVSSNRIWIVVERKDSHE